MFVCLGWLGRVVRLFISISIATGNHSSECVKEIKTNCWSYEICHHGLRCRKTTCTTPFCSPCYWSCVRFNKGKTVFFNKGYNLPLRLIDYHFVAHFAFGHSFNVAEAVILHTPEATHSLSSVKRFCFFFFFSNENTK